MNSIIIGIVVLCVLGLVLLKPPGRRKRSSASNQKLFGDKHLLETAIGVAGLRRTAMDRIDDVSKARGMRLDDPRHFVSTKKVVLVYRIVRDGDKFIHRCSVSLAGGDTPRQVGTGFMALFVHLYGIAHGALEIHVSQKGRYHLAFVMNEEQQETFAEKKLELPGTGSVGWLRNQMMAIAREIRCVPVRTGRSGRG